MGKLAEIKTKENETSVEDFLNAVSNDEKRKHSYVILDMMQRASGERAKMWGASLIGFGNKRYKSPATGREVDWFRIGFSPRKAAISLHLILNLEQQADALKELGKYKTGVGCLYINKLADVDNRVLEELINVAARAK